MAGDLDELRLISSVTRLNWRNFKEVITESETLMMKILWSTCIKDQQLLKCLIILKDVFFLNRGDLYQNIYDAIQRSD